jgi:hypothetical protein
LGFWLFPKLKETADSVKEPAKNSRFLTVLLVIFILKNKNGGYISELVLQFCEQRVVRSKQVLS